MEPIRVFIGTEPKQYIAQTVLADSIRRSTSSPVEIRFCFQQQKRVGGTNFGFVRFMVPSYCNFQGKAIYLDADQLVLQDIRGLWDSLPDDKDLAFVQGGEGMFGNRPVKQANHTSVMVMNCERLKAWDPHTIFNNVVSDKSPLQDGQIHYGDFMYLKWFDLNGLEPLDPRWNHMNILREDTKLIHFTHVASQPWRNPRHPLTEIWQRHLLIAMQRGALKRSELLWAVLKRHLHPHFLRLRAKPSPQVFASDQ